MNMKATVLAVLAIVVIAGIVFVSLNNDKETSLRPVRKDGILTVNDIQANPSAYKGPVTITGVVAKKHPTDPQLFAIVETAEAKQCRSTTCAKFYLPVRFIGPVPEIWDEVNITGSIVKEQGMLFEAANVNVLGHVNIAPPRTELNEIGTR